MEYIFLLGGILLIVSLFTYFLLNTIYAPQTEDLENKTKEYKDLKGQLNEQLEDLGQSGGSQSSPPLGG